MVADHQGGRHQGGVKFVTAVKQGFTLYQSGRSGRYDAAS
jgi:hypothetical protein